MIEDCTAEPRCVRWLGNLHSICLFGDSTVYDDEQKVSDIR